MVERDDRMPTMIAFAVNIGNLEAAGSQRFPMAQLLQDLNAALRAHSGPMRLLDFFAQTGNFSSGMLSAVGGRSRAARPTAGYGVRRGAS